jgi:Flp pilus assembly protein TadG
MPCNLNTPSNLAWDNAFLDRFRSLGLLAGPGNMRNFKRNFNGELAMAARFHVSFFKLRRRTPRARGQKGTTAVEMALIAPAFFLLLIGITEICLIEAGQQLLENATFNTSRLAKTGYTAAGQTQSQSVNQILVNELQSFGTLFNTAQVTMTETDYNSFTSASGGVGGTNGLGAPEQIVVYTVTYPWPLFTPMMGAIIGHRDNNGNWVVNLTSQIVVRNERY